MTARGSPTVRRRRLAMALRQLREVSGMTIEQVAAGMEFSVSKLSRIETGQVGATPRDVRELLTFYGVTGKLHDSLIQVAREAREKGWWHAYGDIDFSAHVGFEAAAWSFRTYDAILVPGLLQTPDYAGAVVRALLPDLPPHQIQRRLDLRRQRQEVLQQPSPPALWAIIDEAVLRRPVGGRAVSLEQLSSLVEVAAHPNVTLQVLPFAAAEHAGMDGAFTILSFPEPGDPDIVYLEHATSTLLLERSEEVQRYELIFNHLRASALKPLDSTAFIAKVIDEF